MAHFTRSFLLGEGIDLSWLLPTHKDTGIQFSTVIDGQEATWNLWEKIVKGTRMDGDYFWYKWSARDPNPGVMQSTDYRITDKYQPPAAQSREVSQQLAAEWAKSPAVLPSKAVPPSNQSISAAPGGGLTLPDGTVINASEPQTPQVSPAYLAAQRIRSQQITDQQAQQALTMEQLQQMGTPAPNYDPVVPTPQPAPAPSKLPLIIGGVAALGIAGFLWWKFRK